MTSWPFPAVLIHLYATMRGKGVIPVDISIGWKWRAIIPFPTSLWKRTSKPNPRMCNASITSPFLKFTFQKCVFFLAEYRGPCCSPCSTLFWYKISLYIQVTEQPTTCFTTGFPVLLALYRSNHTRYDKTDLNESFEYLIAVAVRSRMY